MRFEWSTTDRATFERAVDLLLEQKHARTETAFAPDGRGGDGGVDFWARTRRSLTIYQLKHYTDGFLSSTKTRKQSVKDSFERATQHEPNNWVLVVPAKLTMPERNFVLGLKAPEGRRQPHIRILDLPKLDYLLVKYREVLAYLDRQPLLDAIEERQIEVAEPHSMAEVLDRALKLVERGGNLDPRWGMDLHVVNGNAFAVPREKPGSNAARRSPLGVELTLDSSRMSTETRVVIERSLGYGTGETVVIPEAAVVSIRSTGPAWEWLPGGAIELVQQSPPPVDAVAQLAFLDTDGGVTAVHEGLVTRAAPGALGASISISFYAGMTLELLLPRDRDVPGTINVSVSVHRLFPPDARDALALYRALRAEHRHVRLNLDDKPLLQGTIASTTQEEASADLAILEEFAGDLAELQEHAHVRRRLPTEIPVLDRVLARTARLLLQGNCAFLPPPITMSGTINEGAESDWDAQLRATLREPHAMFARLPTYAFEIAGLSVEVGPTAVYSPAVGVRDAERLLGLLDAGQIGGERIEYVAMDEAGWRVYPLTPEAQTPESAGEQHPTPWNLIGVDEHPALAPTLRRLGR